MLKKLAAFLLACVIPTAALAGCSGNTGGEPVNFGYPIDEMPEHLDPTIADTLSERTIIANCMEGLVRSDADGNIVPGVAETINVSDDGKTYEFKLRQNAKWHVFSDENYFPEGFDNRITARDFVFALRRALDPAMACPDAERFYAIRNAEAVHTGTLTTDQLGVRASDDYTLIIELEQATQDFLSLLTLSAAMPCSEAFFNSTGGRYGLELELMMYNGPYYLSRWDRDSGSVTIVRNVDYVGENPPSANRITFTIDSDEASRYDLVSDGTYDAAVLGAAATADIGSRTRMTVERRENMVWGICINTQDEIMADQNMRLALFNALDPSALEMPDTMASQAYGVIPPSCRIGASAYRDAAGQADLISFDAEKARSFWEQAKTALEVDSVSLKLLCTKEYENQMKRLIQGCQSVFGIAVSIGLESVDEATFEERITDGDYQIAFAPVSAETALPSTFLKQFVSGADGNIFRYKSDIYDDLVSQALAGAGAAVIRRAESHLIQNGVMYPMYTQASSFVQAKNVSGIYLSPVDGTPSFINAQRSK